MIEFSLMTVLLNTLVCAGWAGAHCGPNGSNTACGNGTLAQNAGSYDRAFGVSAVVGRASAHDPPPRISHGNRSVMLCRSRQSKARSSMVDAPQAHRMWQLSQLLNHGAPKYPILQACTGLNFHLQPMRTV